ncbi:uncharacterized protein LOC8284598 [Ricinus communis]|uniref:Uncharacterized protein n=1 Tax=Ricinus communis TaxID=3988 RepID=B9S1F2_RICCO|nr:uncharacterized protein LOC8284598 [Ricinus communis]EEF42421.1 hypothetical protein RCOM_0864500 [Ricinus communis]|eukprot:XP_015575057.1 uncharacterized protein LOC8284598 [Ricinus communis]
MENGKNMNAIRAQDNFIMMSFEQKERPRSRSDIMTCRLKNRERQRRYRARKRMEANMKKASVPNQSARSEEHLEHNGNINNYRIIVHCKRNWKKDARKAHACKSLEEVPSASMISALGLNSEIQTHCLTPLTVVESPLERNNHSENSLSFLSSEMTSKIGRRDWKAEARRKKN